MPSTAPLDAPNASPSPQPPHCHWCTTPGYWDNRCYNCAERGHLSAQCTAPLTVRSANRRAARASAEASVSPGLSSVTSTTICPRPTATPWARQEPIIATSPTAAHAVPRLSTSVIVRFAKPPTYVMTSFLECDIPPMSPTTDATFSRLQRHSPPSFYDTTSERSQCLGDGDPARPQFRSAIIIAFSPP